MPRVPRPPLPDDPESWPTLVTPAQLAPKIGMSVRTLREWCRRGLVPGATRRNPEASTGDWVIPIDASPGLVARARRLLKRATSAA